MMKLGGDPFSDGGEDSQQDEVTGPATGTGLAVELPTGSEWVRMLTAEPTPAMLKAAKKDGVALPDVPNGCKILVLKGTLCVSPRRFQVGSTSPVVRTTHCRYRLLPRRRGPHQLRLLAYGA